MTHGFASGKRALEFRFGALSASYWLRTVAVLLLNRSFPQRPCHLNFVSADMSQFRG